MADCLTEDGLVELANGTAPADRRERAWAHLDECERCRKTLAVVAASHAVTVVKGQPPAAAAPPSEPEPAYAPAPGDKLGRYLLLELIGSGGMGVVYRAYDPSLDRKVAIKLLRTRGWNAASTAALRTRLQREAQAMARLSHPNVLPVHDIGQEGERLFVAMEVVEGGTLRDWLRNKPRSWREILAAYRAAGKGLAAAHDAGLIHRDFKPDNVLIGADGRVRVTDFGLARLDIGAIASGPPTEEQEVSAPGKLAPGPPADQSPLASPMTGAGTLLGTPPYMAPEQAKGQVIGAAADQFAFSVALWEALTGTLPFAARTAQERLARIQKGDTGPVDSRRMPGWLRRSLLRGMRADPAARHASMRELLAALGRDPWMRLRPWALAGAAVVLAVAATVAARWESPVCTGAGEKLAGIWDAGRKTAIERAFLATGKPYAERMWRSAAKALDGYGHAWVAMHGDACRAGVKKEQSPEVLDLRMICLSARLAELKSASDLLAAADAKVVERALVVTGGLQGLAGCADVEALKAPLPLPKDEAARSAVAQARAEVARAKALKDAGRYLEGLEVAKGATLKARATGYGPVLAEALASRGNLEDHAGDLAAAEATLWEALETAVAARHTDAQIHAAGSLAYVTGRRARFEEGVRLGRLALAFVSAHGGDEHPGAAAVLNNLATVYYNSSNYAKALEYHRRSLAIDEKRRGPEDPAVATSLDNLGNTLDTTGDRDGALEHYRRALAIREKALGPEHPDVASTHNNLATAYQAKGDYDRALEHYRRALAIWEKALGPEHPDVAIALDNLGTLHEARGDYDGAIEHHRRALAIKMKAFGPEHPEVATSLYNLGFALNSAGDHGRALEHFQRALAIREKVLGPDHPDVASSHNGLGTVFYDLRNFDRAFEEFRRALAIKEKALGPKHPALATTTSNIGQTLLDARRPAEAVPWLERALAICAASGCAPIVPPEASFGLARALSALGKDRRRALELAGNARESYVRLGEGSAKELAEVEAWLRARPAR